MSASDLGRLSPEGAALFTWFTRLPCFEHREEEITLDSLSDGHLIWKILQDTHPDSFTGDISEGPQASKRWVNNLQNLKRIYKGLRKLMVEDLSLIIPVGLESIDLKAVAEGDDDEETTRLLKWVLNACVNSDLNVAYVLTMTELPKAQQPFLMDIVNSFKRKDEISTVDLETPEQINGRGSGSQMDTELYNEEIYGNLAAENRRLQTDKKDLKSEVRDLTSRLTHLQESHSSLIDELRMVQDQATKSSASVSDSIHMQDLERRIQEQEDHIAEQESVLAEHMARESALSAENNKLRKTNERLQPLQDQVDELKHERDALMRKNNAMERYKVKVQNAQDIENENKDLRREVEDSRHLSKEGDDVRQQNIGLQRQLRELQSLVGNTEVQVMEAQTRRKQVELENADIRQQLDNLKRRREQDRETITHLETRIDSGTSDATGLDIELQQSAQNAHGHDKSRMKDGELSLSTSDSAARARELQQIVDDEHERFTELQQRYNETSKEKLLLEEIVKSAGSIKEFARHDESLAQPTDVPSSGPLFKATTEDLDFAGDQPTGPRYEKAALQHKVSEAEKTLSLMSKDQVETSEKLKGAKSSETHEQHARILSLENQNKTLSTQLDEHRTMLSQMMLTKKHQSELEGSSSEQRKEQFDEREREFRASVEETSQHRERLAKADKQAQEKEQEILELQVKLQQAVDRAAPEVLKASAQAAAKQEYETLKRESRLISSAYFDLSSRLQMNNVSLQRRTDAPRSFLNKQRALVNQATAIRSR